MNDNELKEFILEILPSNGYLTIDAIMQVWLDRTEIMVHEQFKQLEAEGLIKSPKKGQWRLAPK